MTTNRKTFLSRKKHLAILFALQLWASTPLSAQYELDDIDQETYSKHYSTLPSPQENNEKLKTYSQFKSFLEKAEEIVTRYELESYVGLRLLHQHFLAKRDQVIVEEYQVVEETPSLVTWAHSFEDAKSKSALPASWIFMDPEKKPLMFEASTDPEVKIGSHMLQKNPKFMEEMSHLIYTHNLNNLLGVALLKRSSLVGGQDQMYVEHIGENGNISILQLGYEKDQPENIIQTSWSFKGPKQQGCLVISVCQPTPTGGHVNINTHVKY
ncbi:MAG: hypothetical protein BGO67_10635 [Alphaproteobacteria bacterium 41-28]|nr:MAG: hypothetical protein BGO67_10635 [Alphaproteobacteria bacterium 41-28]